MHAAHAATWIVPSGYTAAQGRMQRLPRCTAPEGASKVHLLQQHATCTPADNVRPSRGGVWRVRAGEDK